MRGLLCLTLLLVCSATLHAAVSDDRAVDALSDPYLPKILTNRGAIPDPPVPAGGGPVVVNVSFFVEALHSIDVIKQNFEASLLIHATWRDDRVDKNDTITNLEKVWHPALRVNNVVANSLFACNPALPYCMDFTIEVLDGGIVRMLQRLRLKAFSAFDLAHFYKDKHTLHVDYSSLFYDQSLVKLVGGQYATLSAKEGGNGGIENVKLQEFEVLGLKVNYLSTPVSHAFPDRGEYSMARLSIRVQRYHAFWSSLVVLPLSMIVIISWAVFFMNPLELSQRMSPTFVAFLTLLAFISNVYKEIPKIPYFTKFDGFIITALVLVSLTVPVNIISFRRRKALLKERERYRKAVRKQRAMRGLPGRTRVHYNTQRPGAELTGTVVDASSGSALMRQRKLRRLDTRASLTKPGSENRQTPLLRADYCPPSVAAPSVDDSGEAAGDAGDIQLAVVSADESSEPPPPPAAPRKYSQLDGDFKRSVSGGVEMMSVDSGDFYDDSSDDSDDEHLDMGMCGIKHFTPDNVARVVFPFVFIVASLALFSD